MAAEGEGNPETHPASHSGPLFRGAFNIDLWDVVRIPPPSTAIGDCLSFLSTPLELQLWGAVLRVPEDIQ